MLRAVQFHYTVGLMERETVIDFSEKLNEQKKELYSLIGINESSVHAKEIDYQFEQALKANNSGNFLGAAFNYNRFSLLLIELRLIKKEEPEIFLKVSGDLLHTSDSNKFYGFRFEVHEVAQLIERGIKFYKRESPDFHITNDDIFLECTSARVTDGKVSIEKFQKKLKKIITNKEKLKYAKPNCILKIDITDLLYHLPPDSWQVAVTDLPSYIVKYMKPKKFGAISLSYFVFSQTTLNGGYHFELRRSDEISSCLNAFLDCNYSGSGSSVRAPAIPREA